MSPTSMLQRHRYPGWVRQAIRHPSSPTHQAVNGAVNTISHDVSLVGAQGGFAEYSRHVLKSETVQLQVDGRTGLKLGGLPKTTVNYHKVISMKGLNSLKGFKLVDFKLASKQDDGSNLLGEVLIPNPSVISLVMGNVTLELSIDGTVIGTSTLPNLTIRPGENHAPMRSTVDLVKVLPFVNGQNAKYKNGVIPLTIVGKSAVYNGKDLPYYSAALAANVLHIDMDLGPLLGLGGGN
ncbi:hypothetical protein ACJ72_08650 [Emergomyces africanus]|uniref:Uncharacterized protein n=1 Tax=Emergomyces africanus TaxID=1955775 RepID=A0A1B7NJQ9_9EURO|nr:hypothetical protein ACJ72_08650 [Emergomyces africanus]